MPLALVILMVLKRRALMLRGGRGGTRFDNGCQALARVLFQPWLQSTWHPAHGSSRLENRALGGDIGGQGSLLAKSTGQFLLLPGDSWWLMVSVNTGYSICVATRQSSFWFQKDAYTLRDLQSAAPFKRQCLFRSCSFPGKKCSHGWSAAHGQVKADAVGDIRRSWILASQLRQRGLTAVMRKAQGNMTLQPHSLSGFICHANLNKPVSLFLEPKLVAGRKTTCHCKAQSPLNLHQMTKIADIKHCHEHESSTVPVRFSSLSVLLASGS